jgi:aminopeptidase N
MPSLTRSEALTRAARIAVDSMEVDLDLDRGPQHFGSRTTIRFTCREPGAETFVDLRAHEVHALSLNGTDVDPASVTDGRLALTGLAQTNVLEVDATMAYSP